LIHPFSPSAPELLNRSAAAACVALDRRCLGGFWSENQWHQELQDPQQRLCLGSVLAGSGELVGVCSGWMIVDELQLMLVLVDPRCRQGGLATALVSELLSQARTRGCQQATLEVAATNAPALALYRKLGFTTSGKRRRYYCNGDDALLQWRDLTNF
jgi:ribosomal-protein-alanine N-acetyltransferase|tara:strand:- start:92 stop:562 length:471 start_codon:yes stop_codon:yes gene_type:complete